MQIWQHSKKIHIIFDKSQKTLKLNNLTEKQAEINFSQNSFLKKETLN